MLDDKLVKHLGHVGMRHRRAVLQLEITPIRDLVSTLGERSVLIRHRNFARGEVVPLHARQELAVARRAIRTFAPHARVAF